MYCFHYLRNFQVMVEVFKTNVLSYSEALRILNKLEMEFPSFKMNFDLEDCDKILRIEGRSIVPERIISILNSRNYQCEVLLS